MDGISWDEGKAEVPTVTATVISYEIEFEKVT